VNIEGMEGWRVFFTAKAPRSPRNGVTRNEEGFVRSCLFFLGVLAVEKSFCVPSNGLNHGIHGSGPGGCGEDFHRQDTKVAKE
jgi:hypothetical protein